MTVKKSDIYATVGTIAVCAVVLLILIYCGMSASRDQAAEGIEVSFGYEDDGFGATSESAADEAQPVEPVAASRPAEPNAAPNVDENLMTQRDESLALAQEKKRRQEQEKARLLAEQRERERKAAEEQAAKEQAERERKAAEKAKRDAENKAKAEKAGSLASVFGKDAGNGSGTTTGDSMQGNPVGSGTVGNNGWSLSGRTLRSGLPRPAYKGNEVGRIVVKIRVDRNGNVTGASIDPGASNITNKELRDASVEAAKKVKFSVGGDVAFGTITYRFAIN